LGYQSGITGFTCNTTYHFRAVANNAGGTDYGSDRSFKTSACSIACTAPQTQTLSNQTISDTQTFEACDSIDTGPNFNIQQPGNVMFRAGDHVTLGPGSTVEPGGILIIEIEQPQ
jgi:hypothetical protein